MDRVRRLYIREFLLLITGLSLVMSILFSIFSVVEKADELIEAKFSAKDFIFFGVLQIPEILSYFLPFAGMLCTIFVLSLASRRNEITAIKSSGVNLRVFFIPFIVIGIILSGLNFVISEFLTPHAIEQSNLLMTKGRNNSFIHSTRNLWIRGSDGSVIRIGLYVPEKKQSRDISLFYFDREKPIVRIEAKEGKWIQKKRGTDEFFTLYLHDVTIYDLYNLRPPKKIKEKRIERIISPETLEREDKIIEEMGLRELIRYEKRLREAGFKNKKLLVDIYSRITYPLTNLFMIMIGIAISMRSRKGKGIVAAAIGILISLAYMGCYILSLSLGYAEILPAVVASSAVPFLSLIAGIYFYFKITV